MIQKHVKGWLQRKRYRKITKSVCLLQKYGRGLLARRFVHLCKPIFSSPDQRPCELLPSFGIHRHPSKSVCLLQKYGRGLLARRFVHLCKPIFSSPDQRPCELLPSFGVHRHPSVHLSNIVHLG